ncbi:MAG: phosphate regulon transcriptional regulatory protein PhoB [Acidimicrobiales bacterium]|nr:phosphate regulon transcriptional regulatory protein PhoB [Acidimicrobiales bacterium]
MPRIVVVEDDDAIGATLTRSLESHGYVVSWCRTGAEATAAVAEAPPDLVLLDVGLPDIDGLDLCRRLRTQHRDLPIVVVTARDAEIDVVVGLDAGANDYITKPFSTTILLARIRAQLRGAEPADAGAAIEIGRVRVDPAAWTVSVDMQPIDLRPREFQLLLALCRDAGRVITRERLLADVWDLHWESSTKTLDMHVMALRRKFEDAIEIATVRGVGYRLVVP